MFHKVKKKFVRLQNSVIIFFEMLQTSMNCSYILIFRLAKPNFKSVTSYNIFIGLIQIFDNSDHIY